MSIILELDSNERKGNDKESNEKKQGLKTNRKNCTDIIYSVLEKYILSVNGNQKLTHEELMYIRFFCHGLVGLACEWILGENNTTLEEIAEVYEQSVPDPLKKYL